MGMSRTVHVGEKGAWFTLSWKCRPCPNAGGLVLCGVLRHKITVEGRINNIKVPRPAHWPLLLASCLPKEMQCLGSPAPGPSSPVPTAQLSFSP